MSLKKHCVEARQWKSLLHGIITIEFTIQQGGEFLKGFNELGCCKNKKKKLKLYLCHRASSSILENANRKKIRFRVLFAKFNSICFNLFMFELNFCTRAIPLRCVNFTNGPCVHKIYRQRLVRPPISLLVEVV